MYEDDDAIFRDVEIKPSQTFGDFEAVIITSYNLPASGTGQFYKSNDSWHRLKPLPEPKPAVAVVEKGKGKKQSKSKNVTHDAVPMLVAFIDDPHQKFIFDYSGKQDFSFLIELLSLTGNEKPSVIYPVCIRTQGPSPFKKEELVAHYTKVADEGDSEDHRIDDLEDNLESMGQEGDAEDISLDEDSNDTDEEAADTNEESEDESSDEEGGEDFSAEDFGAGFDEDKD